MVTLTNMADKVEILRSAASLPHTKWNRVYMTPDLPWKEREKRRQLHSELARRREAGEEHIWIRQGRIVPIPVDKRQEQEHATPTKPEVNGHRKSAQFHHTSSQHQS